MAPKTMNRLVWTLVDQIIGRLRQNSIKEIVIAESKEFGGSLVLESTGNWHIVSRVGGYMLPQPVLIDELLTKFARLEDKGFHDFVGILDFYDTYETYHNRSVEYITKYHQELLDKFIERLRFILIEKL